MKLPGRDSNPNYQSQNLACCQLHHPATGAGQYSPVQAGWMPGAITDAGLDAPRSYLIL